MSQTGIKHKPLSIAEKQNTIKEVDGIPNIAGTNITEELGIPVRNITNKMLGPSDTGQKEFRPLKIAQIWHTCVKSSQKIQYKFAVLLF